MDIVDYSYNIRTCDARETVYTEQCARTAAQVIKILNRVLCPMTCNGIRTEINENILLSL